RAGRDGYGHGAGRAKRRRIVVLHGRPGFRPLVSPAAVGPLRYEGQPDRLNRRLRGFLGATLGERDPDVWPAGLHSVRRDLVARKWSGPRGLVRFGNGTVGFSGSFAGGRGRAGYPARGQPPHERVGPSAGSW